MTDKLSSAPEPKALAPDLLRWRCDPGELPFERTDELEPNREIIGQDRALKAIRLGLEMQSPGYNIFLTGFVGTGRNTTIRHVLRTMDVDAEPPPDLCFVHNFENEDRPRALFVTAGQGRRLVLQMKEAVRQLERDVPKVLEDEPYRQRKERIAERFRKRQHVLIESFEKELEADDFALVQVQVGPNMNPQVVPVLEGEPRFLADVEEAVEEGSIEVTKLEELREKHRTYSQQLEGIVRDAIKIEGELQTRFGEHDRTSVRPVVQTCIGAVRERFSDHPEVVAWLKEAEDHIVENIGTLLPVEPGVEAKQDSRTMYEVNLVVDNGARKGRPVIVENTPGASQLFGMLERHIPREGEEVIDHTRIKAGSLHAANGGYLVLNASDLFNEPATVWNALKRTLRTGRVEIPIGDAFSMLGTPALKPEPVCISVKVLLIGDANLYSMLHAFDDDFRKIFKVRADFDTEMKNESSSHLLYGQFVQRIVDEEEILPFDRTAVACVAEFGVRLAGRRNKVSTRFNLIADLVRESSYFAAKDSAELVGEGHVSHALEEREYRNNLAMEKMQELIEEGSVFIDVDGEKIGEVNGLAVYESGEHSFGLPSKITASVSLGNAGIINIEREAELSGRTHDKGVQILSGFLRAKYAQEKPLTLSASICFEQSYHGVDGDSASSTEIYAILSALAGIPLQQGLAVTGSVNQMGEIQPIGGVNEKIEGYFDVCRTKGLNGRQGVLIPRANLEDLMLHPRVIEAVEKGQFRVFSVETIDQGIEILTGIQAGAKVGKHRYPAYTVNGRVDLRLRKLAGLMRDFGGNS